MPDGVCVPDALRSEEEDARRVRDSARDEPRERARGYEQKHRLDSHDAEPAERDVGGDSHGPVARAEDETEEYARERDAPCEAEESPAPSAAQHQERKRRVRARDEHVYAAVVEDL